MFEYKYTPREQADPKQEAEKSTVHTLTTSVRQTKSTNQSPSQFCAPAPFMISAASPVSNSQADRNNEPKLFIDVFREYIERYIQENDLNPETEKHYETFYRNYTLFVASEKLRNLTLEDIRIKHAEMFRGWLRHNLKTCTIRRASRHVELLKRVAKYAVMMEYTYNDCLSPIKAQRDKPKDIIHLESGELKKMKGYKFSSDIMRIVADLFLFQCFTGLSYSDIYTHEIVEKNGKLWIEGYRAKSQENYKIYFFDEAREIHDKYQGKLPRLSNQKYNEYLKEIAGLLGIKKRITTHVGRKTHATILHERGISTETISVQLGNTERVCNESYIRKSHLRSEREFETVGMSNNMLSEK